MAKSPEFAKFGRDCSGGNEDPLKRLFGENLDQFIYVKAKWLWNYLHKSQDKTILNEKYHLLDYGCGTGEMLKWLTLFGFPGYLYGADVSQAMLEEAEKRWGTAQKPLFSCVDETKTDFADNSFSAIKEQKTSAELASLYQVHPGQIRNWKAVFLKGLLDLFSNRRKGKE